jgi:hypothetical protein
MAAIFKFVREPEIWKRLAGNLVVSMSLTDGLLSG